MQILMELSRKCHSLHNGRILFFAFSGRTGQNARQVVTERTLSYVLKKENLHISVVEISVFCTNQIAPGFFM